MTTSYLQRRSAYGTCENKKACGNAEAAAREGKYETAVAQTGTEVRAVPFTTFKTSPHKVSSPEPLGAQSANRGPSTQIALVSHPLHYHRILQSLGVILRRF